jgi:transketolase
MAVLAPCDPAEARLATLWCTAQERGPVYLRLGRAGEPDLTASAVDGFEFGKLRYLKRGRDVCIIGYGSILKVGAKLAAKFEARGDSVSLVSAHTVKPLDKEGVEAALRGHKRVVVIEEMAPSGGLGPRVKEIAWNIRAHCRLDTFALQDAFIHNYGSHGDLLAAHGLDAMTLAARLGLN